MRAVEFNRYGPAEEVLAVVEREAAEAPGCSDLLVRVHASSVNPIDCAVRRGYGREFFETRGMSRWPNRPGRDLAGEVVATGPGVRDFRVGDQIYAATLGGANADYVTVPAAWAALKPTSLSFVEAAALPYSALTTWSALCDAARLSEKNAAGKRVLIARASGGVGSFAVQLVKAWNGYVAALCSTRNLALVRSLGADEVIDYTRNIPADLLQEFDVAFDSSFNTEELLLRALKWNEDAAYVTIVSPRLRLIDEYGLNEGLRLGDELFSAKTVKAHSRGQSYHWVFTRPNGEALREVADLVDAGKIRPLIDRCFDLSEIAIAHEYCESARARGKIVIDLSR